MSIAGWKEDHHVSAENLCLTRADTGSGRVAGTSAAARARPRPGAGTPGGSMPGMGSMPMMAAMAGHVEGRLAFLKTELKITDAQLPLWNAVADAIRANVKSMGEMSGGVMGNSQTA